MEFLHGGTYQSVPDGYRLDFGPNSHSSLADTVESSSIFGGYMGQNDFSEQVFSTLSGSHPNERTSSKSISFLSYQPCILPVCALS